MPHGTRPANDSTQFRAAVNTATLDPELQDVVSTIDQAEGIGIKWGQDDGWLSRDEFDQAAAAGYMNQEEYDKLVATFEGESQGRKSWKDVSEGVSYSEDPNSGTGTL